MIGADKAGRDAEEEDNGAALVQIGSTESGKQYTVEPLYYRHHWDQNNRPD